MDEFTPSGPERQQDPGPVWNDDPAATNGCRRGAADSGTLAAALAYLAAGLSVIPIRRDGTKRPTCRWEPYQQEPAGESQIRKWFHGTNPPGVAVIGGAVSGELECLDFDAEASTIFPAWCELVEAELPGLVKRLSVARTPNHGYHVRYRCPDVDVPGNTKLAMDPGTKVVLIETRGRGGYALAPGCPAECHQTGRLYVHHSGPPLELVQTIGIEERYLLIRCAASFDRVQPEPSNPKPERGPGLSPGDDFDQRGPDWPGILGPHGWVAVHHQGTITYWRRPGKEGKGWSATTGACTSKAGRPLFCVFSSNAVPFPGPESGRSCSTHSKFAVFTLLNHGGDFSAAAKALSEQGYGQKREKTSSPSGATALAAGEPNQNGHGDGQQDIHETDKGNAKHVVKRHGRDLHFVHPWKTWLVWDGIRWAEDQTGEAVRRVKETQATLYQWAADKIKELSGLAEDDPRNQRLPALVKLLGHCLKWEDTRAISRCLESARSEPGVPVLPPDLDTDPMLLNVLNGTIDLRTGRLRGHRREDLLTKLAPVMYDEAATCPLWERSLDRWMGGNTDLSGYLQRLVGYGLTADVSEQCLWFFHGSGANGKSTFLLTILAMLGDYAMQAVSDLLMVKHNESHPTERADLFGKRLVATIETEEGKRMAEALMKQMTGGDKVRARKLFKDFFEFLPTHKIVLAANHKPVVRGTDHAVWRRIKLVPFTVTIPEEEKDKKLPDKLRAELPGILNWGLRGCLDWHRHGLGEPDEVRQATAEYQAEQDTVQGFLDECCNRHPEAKVQSSALLAAYHEWSGDKLMTAPAFRKCMKAKGFESKEGTSGRWFWRGLGLIQATPEGDDSGGRWG